MHHAQADGAHLKPAAAGADPVLPRDAQGCWGRQAAKSGAQVQRACKPAASPGMQGMT